MNLAENVDGKQNYRVGLGVCGGIAAYKAIEVLRGLQKAGCRVKVAMTKHATEFIKPLTFRALTDEYVLVDDYDISNPDPIAHINFSQNIDLLVIVPATANILAKFANGIADDFLTATYLASTAPTLIAPAMNSTMLAHAATQRNLRRLELDGVHFVESQYGEMACKTVGFGRLNEPSIIVEKAISLLKAQVEKDKIPSTLDFGLGTLDSEGALDLKSESFLITTGATREELDPVRFISNHSSGKMGFAMAEAARKRGAKVTVICGVTSVTPPENVRIIKAISAEEMHKAVLSEIKDASVFVAAAAVADYRPKTREPQKIKKRDDVYILELEKTRDILADVSAKRHENLMIIGFAAETENVISNARVKLQMKKLDLMVANDVSKADSGFNVETNRITILAKTGGITEFPLLSKAEAADKVLDEIVILRHNKEVKI